jgi:VanZ family protein
MPEPDVHLRQGYGGQVPPRFRRRSFAFAILVAAALVLGAPFIGQLRSAIRGAFPGRLALIVGAAVGAALVVAFATALIRIRDRRPLRYGLLAAALVIGAGYALAAATGIPESDAVERFHFVEYGLITLLFYRAWRPAGDLSVLILPALAGLIVGACDEWYQWFIPARVGELKDIFLNLVAIGCGLLFAGALDPPEPFIWRLRAESWRRVGLMEAAAVLVVAAFFHAVHLGHEIREGAVTFDSRYTRTQLLGLAAERAQRWRTNPPPLQLKRMSREDQYMTEGLQHVQRRNDAWKEGDFTAAWQENLILEQYFAPVLDTPSYASPTPPRWPPEQRADAEARGTTAAANGTAYVSQAYPYKLYVWPPVRYWLAVGAIVMAILGAALARKRTTA